MMRCNNRGNPLVRYLPPILDNQATQRLTDYICIVGWRKIGVSERYLSLDIEYGAIDGPNRHQAVY